MPRRPRLLTYLPVFRLPPLPPFTKASLIAFFVCLVLENVALNFLGLNPEVVLALMLTTGSLGVENLWQLFTHPFLSMPGPEGLTGFLISGLFYWWMMAPFEARYGGRRAAQLAVAVVLGSGLAALIVGSFFTPALIAGFGEIVSGVIAAYAWSLRGRGSLSLFGVVDLRAEQLLGLLVAFTFLQFIVAPSAAVLAAGLASIGIGVAFMEWMQRQGRPKKTPRKRKDSGSRRRRNGLRVIEGEGEGGGESEPPKWLN